MEVLCEEEDTCFYKIEMVWNVLFENVVILVFFLSFRNRKKVHIWCKSNHLSITREFVLMKMSCSRDCLTLNKTWRRFKDSKIYETTSGMELKTRSTWRRSLCTFWASSKVEESVATLSSIWPTWTQKSDSCPKIFNCQPPLSASHELSQGRLRLQADAGALLALPRVGHKCHMAP